MHESSRHAGLVAPLASRLSESRRIGHTLAPRSQERFNFPAWSSSLYTLAEVEAIHAAFTEALETAKDREERMPSSAAAFRARAENIKSVRNKILATLPERHRRNYPP